MPDPTTVATSGGVLATVVASVASFLDIRAIKARVDALDATILPGILKKIDEVAAAIDPKLRGDLNALAERVARYRKESAVPGGPQRAPTGSFPQLDDRDREQLALLIRTVAELTSALASHDRRIAANAERIVESNETANETRDIVIALRAVVEMLREDRKRG